LFCGFGVETKFIVVIAIEVLPSKDFGRVRMRRVDDVSGASSIPFVSAAVEFGSEVHADGWKGYNSLSEQGFTHRVTVPLSLVSLDRRNLTKIWDLYI
jgi:hypothetical protein